MLWEFIQRGSGAGQAGTWADFNGVDSAVILDGALAGDAHNVNGDFTVLVALVKLISGELLHIGSSADVGPWIKIDDTGTAGKSRYRLRQDNFVILTDEETSADVYTDTIALVYWGSEDLTPVSNQAELQSSVDGSAPFKYGIDSEIRQAQGVNWPPDEIRLGGKVGAGGVPLLGQVGWAATAQRLIASPAGIFAAYQNGGRAALSGALRSDLGVDPTWAQVLDGVSGPDYGSAPVFNNIKHVLL